NVPGLGILMFDLLGETDLVAGLAAAAAFVVLVFALGVVVWVSLPLAVLVYLGARLAIPRPDEAARALPEGATRAARIQRLAGQIDPTTHPEARRQAEEIARLTETALTLIRSSPTRRGYAVPFLTDYLTPIEAVLTPYVQLAGRGVTLADKDL